MIIAVPHGPLEGPSRDAGGAAADGGVQSARQRCEESSEQEVG